GFGEGGGELLSDRPFLSFLLPHIAGKEPPSDLSVRVKHCATGEGVGRLAMPRLLSPIPRVAKRTPLHHCHSTSPTISAATGNRNTRPTRSLPGSIPGLSRRIS